MGPVSPSPCWNTACLKTQDLDHVFPISGRHVHAHIWRHLRILFLNFPFISPLFFPISSLFLLFMVLLIKPKVLGMLGKDHLAVPRDLGVISYA